MSLKIMTVVGARPQLIKAAVFSRLAVESSSVDEQIVHTGQHFDSDMSDVFFDELGIPDPARHLGIHGGGHGDMTGRMLQRLEPLMVEAAPDCVLVYGDTNSTLAGALAAAKLHIPVVHVEAGLRSFNRAMPEEINRVMADHLSDLLFCPTREAVKNLESEGINEGVHFVGDVMYDATRFAGEQAAARSSLLERLGVMPGEYGLCTVHRAENTDDEDRFLRVMDFLRKAAEERPIVFPVHPRTRQVFDRTGYHPANLILIEPLGYLDMHRLLSDAAAVYTDSGGLQKEAYFYRVPCVTLRDETEWIETIEAGWNRLWTQAEYRPRREIDDYGDGKAGEKILSIMQGTLT